MVKKVKLGVNIDHIATLRNARGEGRPNVLRAAQIARDSGADGITVHLREDRRHIKDNDVFEINENINLPLNFECAATEEMLGIALRLEPNSCCLVPEKRMELTTEGGLNVIGNFESLANFASHIKQKGIKASFFIDADIEQLKAANDAGADIVEFHTGTYCNAFLIKDNKLIESEFQKLEVASHKAEELGMVVHAGHGLDYDSAQRIVKIPQVEELNIGHFIIGEAIFEGLPKVISNMRDAIIR